MKFLADHSELSLAVSICPQCGIELPEQNAAATGARPEFCPRCGSPIPQAGLGFHDPLRFARAGHGRVHINRKAKLVLRFGVFMIGVFCMISGYFLFYGGWIDSGSADAVQLWVSRIGGPLLLIQGFMQAWVPFKPVPARKKAAQVIEFPRNRTIRRNGPCV